MRARKRTYLSRIGLATLVVAACAMVLGPYVSHAAVSGSELVVQGLDTSDYPAVSLKVSLPESFPTGDVAFDVLENSESVEDLEAELINAQEAPPRVALILDVSGSMRGGPLDDARAAATRFSESLGDEASIVLITFNGKPSLLGDFGADRAHLQAALDDLTAGGETALYDAIIQGAESISDPTPGQRAIVLLSDGADDSSNKSFETAMESVREAGVPVYAIALQSQDYNPQALITLATGSGGRMLTVASSSELEGFFTGIAEEIQSTYALTYTSREPRTKDIEVDVSAVVGDARATTSLYYPLPTFEVPADASASDVAADFTPPGMTPIFLAAVLAFGAVGLLVVGVLTVLVRQETGLAHLHYYDQLRAQAELPDAGTATDQIRAKVVSAVGVVASRRGLTQIIAEKLEQAGLPIRPAEYMTLHLLLVVGLGVLAQLLVGNFVLSFTLVVMAALLPVLALDMAIDKRRRRFEAQLPDVLSMIAVSLRGGWGLLQSVDFVVQQAGPPADVEFKRVQTESRLGMPLEQSLERMARRLQSPDFDAAVTAMNIQREVGGNLAEILDIVSKTVRDRSALRRQVAALTAEGRLSAIILMALPFLEAIALLIMSPGYLDPMFKNPIGIAMSVGAILLLAVGGMWLRSVTRIEV